ncbi:MAG: hypothetical protein H6813_04010 [Phycisphaeraceae bacterium]|nr:hypothetical protein [Phycisphaeraceae bacterium]MCB9847111.1 hypothetical protein [Phycisphaeraceae bacterium]
MIRRALDTALALYELLTLAAITRFRFRGEYWAWRWQTALGPGPRPSRGEIVRRLLRYGLWRRKMRTGRW